MSGTEHAVDVAALRKFFEVPERDPGLRAAVAGELTLDFVRLDFATGTPPTHGIVVARVACPPALVGRLITLAKRGIAEYSSRLGEEPLDGGSLDL